MSWIQFEDCERVYSASSGGYWQAFGSGLLFVVLVALALPGLNQPALDVRAIRFLLVLALFMGPAAYFAVAAAMRQYNSKVGVSKDGVLVQDWRGRRRFIQWRHIAGLTQATRKRKSEVAIVLSLDVRNALGETEATQIGYYSSPIHLPWLFPAARGNELRDYLIHRCSLTEGETDQRTGCGWATGIFGTVERRVWHK